MAAASNSTWTRKSLPLFATASHSKITSGGCLNNTLMAAGTKTKQYNWWCAACGGQYNRWDPNRVLVVQAGGDPRAHAPPQGACEHLVCALDLLANLQAGGDNLVDTIFECLQERSRLS